MSEEVRIPQTQIGFNLNGVSFLNGNGNEVVYKQPETVKRVLSGDQKCQFYIKDGPVQTLDSNSDGGQLRMEVLFDILSQRAADGDKTHVKMRVEGNQVIFSDDTGELARFDIDKNGNIVSVKLNGGAELTGNAYFKFFTVRLMGEYRGGANTSNVGAYKHPQPANTAPSAANPAIPDQTTDLSQLSREIDAANQRIDSLLRSINSLGVALTKLSDEQLNALIESVILIYPESRQEFQNATGVERYALVEKYLQKLAGDKELKKDENGAIIVSTELLNSISSKLNEVKAKIVQPQPQTPPQPVPIVQTRNNGKLWNIFTGNHKVEVRTFRLPPEGYWTDGPNAPAIQNLMTPSSDNAAFDPNNPAVAHMNTRGYMTREDAYKLGWSKEFFDRVDGSGDDVIDIDELMIWAGQITRSATAQFPPATPGQPVSKEAINTVAGRYKKAIVFGFQDTKAFGAEMEAYRGEIQREMDSITPEQAQKIKDSEPKYKDMTLEEVKFLVAIKKLGAGANDELWNLMIDYINEGKKAGKTYSQNQLFEHYFGFIAAAGCNEDDQLSLYGIKKAGGIAMLAWNGRVADVRKWFRGEPEAYSDVREGDPGAVYDIQTLKERWQYLGTYDTMMSLIEAGEWDQAYQLAGGFINELKQILAHRPKSYRVLSEINGMFRKILNAFFESIRQKFGGGSNFVAALISRSPDGTPNFKKLNGLLSIIGDYETFIINSGRFDTGENVSKISDWRKAIATQLCIEARSLNQRTVEDKKSKTPPVDPKVAEANKRAAAAYVARAKEIYDGMENDIRHAQGLADGNVSADTIREDRALLGVELARAVVGTDQAAADKYIEDSLKTADTLPPSKAAAVYVAVFKYLYDQGKYADAIALLNPSKGYKGHKIPAYDRNWPEQDVQLINQLLADVKGTAGRNQKHEGGLHGKEGLPGIRTAIENYLKGDITAPAPDDDHHGGKKNPFPVGSPEWKKQNLKLGLNEDGTKKTVDPTIDPKTGLPKGMRKDGRAFKDWLLTPKGRAWRKLHPNG